uniref:Uncharacterized protein n=1 Tax=Candidatus Kentrum sp. LFY TaxID=2126342 RepID=A0A450U5V0_9GAMM|nr:MAG: hypothetical protein BECKLFY1418B_GA0070995_100445 [Candidatus Kentron sp. LFY]
MLGGDVLEEAERYLTLFEDIQSRYAALAEKIEPDVLQDLPAVDDFLTGIEQLNRFSGPDGRTKNLGGGHKQIGGDTGLT